jgi:hypothetical protein
VNKKLTELKIVIDISRRAGNLNTPTQKKGRTRQKIGLEK